MLSINAIGHYIPKNHINNLDQALNFSMDDSFVRDKLGCINLPVMASDEDTSDLGVNAIKDLVNKTNLDLSQVDCLIVCTQNPDGQGLPHTSAIIQSKLGLPTNIAAFDISLGCSGYVYGISVLSSFMEKFDFQNGLLVTADPYSKVINRSDKNTTMLFGDAATATLVSHSSNGFKIVDCKFGTDGRGADDICVRDGLFNMNGRNVFNFAAKTIPKHIIEVLDYNSLTMDCIDRIYLHQGSKYIVNTIAKRLSVDAEKCPVDIALTGNTVSSSIPLLLEKDLNDVNLDRIIMSGFGVGLSWATCIMEKMKNV